MPPQWGRGEAVPIPVQIEQPPAAPPERKVHIESPHAASFEYNLLLLMMLMVISPS